MKHSVTFVASVAFVVVAACRREGGPPPEQVYQNGYPQAQPQQVTYQNGYAQQGYPQQQGAPPPQVAPPPQGQQAATPVPAPSAPAPATATATATAAPTETMIGVGPAAPAPPVATMAVPGMGALACNTDAACILGRCNMAYKRCAYPCKNSAADCAPNAACGPLGLCVPH